MERTVGRTFDKHARLVLYGNERFYETFSVLANSLVWCEQISDPSIGPVAPTQNKCPYTSPETATENTGI